MFFHETPQQITFSTPDVRFLDVQVPRHIYGRVKKTFLCVTYQLSIRKKQLREHDIKSPV